MAFVTQKGSTEALSALTGLVHDIFVGDVVANVRTASVTARVFREAQPGADYRLEGQNMIFATDLEEISGAMATSGNLPNHVGLDAVQGKLTPVRRYRRIALDNLVEKRASGDAAFEEFADRIFRVAWQSWRNMEIRHSIGDSTGLITKVSSRTSSTVWVAKDAYGLAGNPLTQVHLPKNARIGWYDVSAANTGGAGKISSITYAATTTVTMDSATTWEPTATLAANDLIYYATSNDKADDHFELERDNAPNGVGTIVDPTAASTTVFNIAQGTYGLWKPYRKASVTPDHLELTEHWLTLGAKRGYDVTPEQDCGITHPTVAAEFARSLISLQQQAYTGTQLRGGYNLGGASGNSEGDDMMPHAGLVVSGIPIYSDGFFYHNVLVTMDKSRLFRITLGGDADWWAEDGSMWERIANYDGREAFLAEYMNYFSNGRGANGALTGIATTLAAADLTGNTPGY